MIAKALREFIRVSQGKIVVGISAFEGQEDAGIVHSPEVDAPRLPIVKQTREWWTQMFEDVGLHPDRDMWQSFNQSLESLGPDWKTRQGASGEWFALQFVGGALAQVTAPGAGERSSGDTPLTMKYDALGLYADTSPITEAAPAPSGQQGKLEKQRKKEAKEEEDRARMEKGGPPPGFSAEDWSSYLKRAAYGELEHQSKRKHLEVMRVRAKTHLDENMQYKEGRGTGYMDYLQDNINQAKEDVVRLREQINAVRRDISSRHDKISEQSKALKKARKAPQQAKFQAKIANMQMEVDQRASEAGMLQTELMNRNAELDSFFSKRVQAHRDRRAREEKLSEAYEEALKKLDEQHELTSHKHGIRLYHPRKDRQKDEDKGGKKKKHSG